MIVNVQYPVGNPARVIKYRFDDDTIRKLQEMKWWFWPENKIKNSIKYMGDIDKFIEMYYKETGKLKSCDDVEQLRVLKERDFHLYGIRVDNDIDENILAWEYIVEKFVKTYNSNDKKVLLLFIPQKGYAKIVDKAKAITGADDNIPVILPIMEEDGRIPLEYVSILDTLITTKEVSCNPYIDYASDFGIELKYALESDIFCEF